MLKQWTKTVTICQTPKQHKEWRALKCKLVTFNSQFHLHSLPYSHFLRKTRSIFILSIYLALPPHRLREDVPAESLRSSVASL